MYLSLRALAETLGVHNNSGAHGTQAAEAVRILRNPPDGAFEWVSLWVSEHSVGNARSCTFNDIFMTMRWFWRVIP